MRAPKSGTKRKDGYWRVTVTVTYPDGTKKPKGFVRKTAALARKAAQEFTDKQGRIGSEEHTMAELIAISQKQRWNTLEQNTKLQYDMACKRIGKFFGKLKDIRSIDTPLVASFVASLDKEGELSGRGIQIHRNVLRIMLKFAAELGWREPTEVWAVRLPRSVKPTERRRLSYMEGKGIVEQEPNAERRLFWWTLMETALRPIEATRLTKENIVYSQDSWWADVKQSKTDAGVRRVMLSDDLGKVLYEAEGERIFPGISFETGMNRRTVSHWFHAACKRAGVPKTNLYQLRKLRIAMWKAAGVPDEVVIQMAGHTDIRITNQVYDEVTRDRIARALEGKF